MAERRYVTTASTIDVIILTIVVDVEFDFPNLKIKCLGSKVLVTIVAKYRLIRDAFEEANHSFDDDGVRRAKFEHGKFLKALQKDEKVVKESVGESRSKDIMARVSRTF